MEFKPDGENILFSMEYVSITGFEGRFFNFFFLHDVEQDILKILQEEKLANMDSIEFHKISHMTNE